MPYRCLVDFLEDLGRAGDLTRVEEEVDPVLQVADMAGRAAKSGGPALLFGAVKGHDLPVLCNLLATESRIGRALGVEGLDQVADRIARLLDATAPEGWFERLKAGAQPAALASIAPRKVKSAACQQIVRLGGDVNLGELPLLQVAPEKMGTGSEPVRSGFSQSALGEVPVPIFSAGETPSAITAATVLSAEPDSHRPVLGQFDLTRLDRTRLAVCWATHDEHARLLGEYRARNQKMPLAVVIGGDPAFLLAAAAPLPPVSDVCAVAGLLREKSLDVVACRGVDLDVPAEAEIILEGFCDPAELPVEVGPLCGPTGHCTQPAAGAGNAGHRHHASGQPDLCGDGTRPPAARGLHGGPGHAAGVPAAGAIGDAGVGRLRSARVRRRAALGGRVDSQELSGPRPPRGPCGLGIAAHDVCQGIGRGRG